MKENDVVTIGCDNYIARGVLQRRNKLKGTAQQKLLLKTMDSKDDISINTLRKLFEEKISTLYTVEVPIIINNMLFERKSDYIIYDALPDEIDARTREMIKDRTYKECSSCGQKISAFNYWSRRCYRCMEGNFRFPIEKIQHDCYISQLDAKDRVIEKLAKGGYIKQCTFLNKRLDFFRFHDGIFDVFESKNKEKTTVTYSDYFRSLRYPIMIEQCGYDVKQLTIVYNGALSQKIIKRFLMEAEEKYSENRWIEGPPTKAEVLETPIDIFKFKVIFTPIGKYLKEHGVAIEKIIVTKKDKKYIYELVEGNSEFVTIDLSNIDPESIVDLGELNPLQKQMGV